MDYVIKVADRRLQESRERQCFTEPVREFSQCRCMDPNHHNGSQGGAADKKPHVVLLRFTDEDAITPSAYCMVAVRASQAGVKGADLRKRCQIWGIMDGDFVEWVESQGGELYRNDPAGVFLIERDEGFASTWCCKFGDHYGEGRYTFEAVVAALDDRQRALLPSPKWITAPDERIQAACR